MEIVGQQKMEAKDFSTSLISDSSEFDQFLMEIPPQLCDGFCSQPGQKFVQKTHSISYEQAKKIHLDLSERVLIKSKKNWKNEQVSLLLYLVDKVCWFHKCEPSDLQINAWTKISNLMIDRDTESCKSKVFNIIPSSLNEKPWTEIEQQILSEII